MWGQPPSAVQSSKARQLRHGRWQRVTCGETHKCMSLNIHWRGTVVQELGHVLNYLSLEERLPTEFKPVSPPPCLNVGPRDYLSWVIECKDRHFKPETCAQWLEAHLPRPVNKAQQWNAEADE
jgi:hypothetical protein